MSTKIDPVASRYPHLQPLRSHLRHQLALLASLLICLVSQAMANEGCLACHGSLLADIERHHRQDNKPCTSCHDGNGEADDEATAHDGLISRPGELGNEGGACADCHPLQHAWVQTSPMRTNAGIVAKTRQVLGAMGDDGIQHIDSLGSMHADSLLRKLCSSCHLGQPLTSAGGDPIDDRGGGCLACHLRPATRGKHPRVDALIPDSSCFGCHSRSGRIALSYAGLAEVIPHEVDENNPDLARLGDGRWVSHQQADIHHRAGMGCIDCHTGFGLMGGLHANGGRNTDIACDDCHSNTGHTISLDQWPASSSAVLKRLPFEPSPDQIFMTTGRGTPLWHIEVRDGQAPLLHVKSGSRVLAIPQIRKRHFPLANAHLDLTCDACHASWSPQCFGCHLSYEADGYQWDHLSKRLTPGAWQERRWNIRNAAPTLGRRGDGQVDVFVPGMIMTLDHPDLQDPLFLRRFARLSPHTNGQARPCESCHRDPHTLGLGDGVLSYPNGTPSFSPTAPRLQDGLPADAWTSLDSTEISATEDHPFTPAEILKLLSVPISSP